MPLGQSSLRQFSCATFCFRDNLPWIFTCANRVSIKGQYRSILTSIVRTSKTLYYLIFCFFFSKIVAEELWQTFLFPFSDVLNVVISDMLLEDNKTYKEQPKYRFQFQCKERHLIGNAHFCNLCCSFLLITRFSVSKPFFISYLLFCKYQFIFCSYLRVLYARLRNTIFFDRYVHMHHILNAYNFKDFAKQARKRLQKSARIWVNALISLMNYCHGRIYFANELAAVDELISLM